MRAQTRRDAPTRQLRGRLAQRAVSAARHVAQDAIKEKRPASVAGRALAESAHLEGRRVAIRREKRNARAALRSAQRALLPHLRGSLREVSERSLLLEGAETHLVELCLAEI